MSPQGPDPHSIAMTYPKSLFHAHEARPQRAPDHIACLRARASVSDAVSPSQLDAVLRAHAADVSSQLSAQRQALQTELRAKAELSALASVEAAVAGRLGHLEAAILKGLRQVSDKASAALMGKLGADDFDTFRLHVRAVLADLQDRLADLTPVSAGSKAPVDRSHGAGATSCLACDARVRSARELVGHVGSGGGNGGGGGGGGVAGSFGTSQVDVFASAEPLPAAAADALLPRFSASTVKAGAAPHAPPLPHRRPASAAPAASSRPATAIAAAAAEAIAMAAASPKAAGVSDSRVPACSPQLADRRVSSAVGGRGAAAGAASCSSSSNAGAADTISGMIAQGRLPRTAPGRPASAWGVGSLVPAKLAGTQSAGKATSSNGPDLTVTTFARHKGGPARPSTAR
eukprot:351140-Chlamydomonas_euryale.AAC.2